MSARLEFAAARPPRGAELEGLRQHAKQLQAAEMARLFRRLLAGLGRLTRDGLDPRVYADKVNPPRRYSSAYF
jgi:hypothetical protein